MRCLALALAGPCAHLFARLPQAVLLKLSTLSSWLFSPLLARRRRIAAINLALCYPEIPDPARRRLLRDNQRATMMGMFELLRAWYAPASALASFARIEGIEHLRGAQAAGRGVLLFTAHFTSTELAARLLSEQLGRKVRVVVRRNNSPCLEQWLERARARVFGPTLAKKDVRGLLRALKDGEAVVYSADQDFNYQNAFVPFFGVAASTLTSTPELVRRADADMLVFFFHRDAEGRYQCRITPAWPGWRDAEPAQAATIYMQALEMQVRAHPAQYLWFHRRFKTRPPGELDVYR